MTELIKISTQETISLKQLKETYRNVAFPKDLENADLSSYDAAVVVTDPQPSFDPATQTIELSEPTLVDGVWRRTWAVAPKKIDLITMRQCRLELAARGLLAAINEQVSLLPEAAQIEWEYATKVQKNSSFVQELTQAIGLDQASLDDFFMEAAQR